MIMFGGSRPEQRLDKEKTLKRNFLTFPFESEGVISYYKKDSTVTDFELIKKVDRTYQR